MVQLGILSGRQAGVEVAVHRFPFRIGREAGADFRLEEEGVWDQHARLELQVPEGIWLASRVEAPVAVNGSASTGLILHNGDVLELGAVKIRFWLGETVQREQRLREALTWGAVASLGALQVGLIYWMTG